MTELGSDERFAGLGDTSRFGHGVRIERVRARLEEWRVSVTEPADDPGVDHPDPDEAPPADEPHPEFDPLPGG